MPSTLDFPDEDTTEVPITKALVPRDGNYARVMFRAVAFLADRILARSDGADAYFERLGFARADRRDLARAARADLPTLYRPIATATVLVSGGLLIAAIVLPSLAGPMFGLRKVSGGAVIVSLAIAGACGLLIAARRRAVRRACTEVLRARGVGVCHGCGFDLRGLDRRTEYRCPECGVVRIDSRREAAPPSAAIDRPAP